MNKYFCVFAVLLSACMCTDKPDQIVISGVELYAPSRHYLFSSRDLLLQFSSPYYRQNGKKDKCLTYSKEKAMDIISNPIIASSVELKCNRQIDTFPSGSQLLINPQISNNGVLRDGFCSLSHTHLMKDSIYDFVLSCRTAKGEYFESKRSVLVLP